MSLHGEQRSMSLNERAQAIVDKQRMQQREQERKERRVPRNVDYGLANVHNSINGNPKQLYNQRGGKPATEQDMYSNIQEM